MVDIGETREDCSDSCIYTLEDSLDGQSFCFGEGVLPPSCTAQPSTAGLQKVIQEANESKKVLEKNVVASQLKRTSLKRITSVFDMIQESIISSQAEQKVCSEPITKIEEISKLLKNETRDIEAAVKVANSLEGIIKTNNECSTVELGIIETKSLQATRLILQTYIEIDVSDNTSSNLLLVFEKVYIAAVSALTTLLSNVNSSTPSSSNSCTETDLLFSSTTPTSPHPSSTSNHNTSGACSTGNICSVFC